MIKDPIVWYNQDSIHRHAHLKLNVPEVIQYTSKKNTWSMECTASWRKNIHKIILLCKGSIDGVEHVRVLEQVSVAGEA